MILMSFENTININKPKNTLIKNIKIITYKQRYNYCE